VGALGSEKKKKNVYYNRKGTEPHDSREKRQLKERRGAGSISEKNKKVADFRTRVDEKGIVRLSSGVGERQRTLLGHGVDER